MRGSAAAGGEILSPGRWSDAQILEEHAFVRELAEREIPVVAPLTIGGKTLHQFGGYRFALYPTRGGRTPELEDRDDARMDGSLHRAHPRGRRARGLSPRARRSISRPSATNRAIICSRTTSFRPTLRGLSKRVGEGARWRAPLLRARRRRQAMRLHGDCHAGNVLWTEDGPHFVDFDDAAWGRRCRTCGCCSRASAPT